MSALMTIKEFQEQFRVSRSTVYRLKERGCIGFVRIGRSIRIRRVQAEGWAECLC